MISAMAFLVWLRDSGFSTWLRESGTIWSYPTVLFLHTLGLAILVGFNSTLDLRVLGVASRLPLPVFDRLFPLLWGGFWINALSGAALFVADAPAKATDPVFGIKLTLIALAIVNMVWLRRELFRNRIGIDTGRPMSAKGKMLAATSLLLWIGATTAGRLMAYTKTFSIQ